MTHDPRDNGRALRITVCLLTLSLSLSLHSLAQCTLNASATVSANPDNQYKEVTLTSAAGGDYTFASGGSAPGNAGGRTWMISNVHGPWTDIAWTISQALLTNPRHSSQAP